MSPSKNKHKPSGAPAKTRILLLAGAVVLLAGVLAGVNVWEKRSVPPPERAGTVVTGSAESPRVLTQWNGGLYALRDDLETTLLIGVDHFINGTGQSSYEQADFLVLIAADPRTEEVTAIQFNRDTMTPVDFLDDDGNYITTLTQQLALAHTYGGSQKRCCENTVNAVSRILRGVPIRHYVSVTMDAIGILNDAVGGVTITVPEDMTMVDPELAEGQTVTLHGDQALSFVRARMGVGSGLNTSRMQRQKQYITEFQKQYLAKSAADSGFSTSTLMSVNDYMVSDCTVDQLSALLNTVGGYDLGETIIPEGQNVYDNAFIEFYLDQAAMQELAMETFYDRVGDA